MKKTNFFKGTVYASLFITSLLVAGCDTLHDFWGSNNQPYYSVPNEPRESHNRSTYSKRMAARVHSSKQANTTHTTHTTTAGTANYNSSNLRSVAPKVSSTSGSALDSPVIPTTIPAVDQ